MTISTRAVLGGCIAALAICGATAAPAAIASSHPYHCSVPSTDLISTTLGSTVSFTNAESSGFWSYGDPLFCAGTGAVTGAMTFDVASGTMSVQPHTPWFESSTFSGQATIGGSGFRRPVSFSMSVTDGLGLLTFTSGVTGSGTFAVTPCNGLAYPTFSCDHWSLTGHLTVDLPY